MKPSRDTSDDAVWEIQMITLEWPSMGVALSKSIMGCSCLRVFLLCQTLTRLVACAHANLTQIDNSSCPAPWAARSAHLPLSKKNRNINKTEVKWFVERKEIQTTAGKDIPYDPAQRRRQAAEGEDHPLALTARQP